MDKYEYRVRLDEINTLVEERRFAEAADIADSIDWRKVKSARTLCRISDIYKVCKDYERARDILDIANQREPHVPEIIYSLCELTIYLYGQMGSQSDLAKAIGLRQQYESEFPDDPKRLILEYKFYKVSPVTVGEKITTLEQLRAEDHSARWGYELAALYRENGQDDLALDECKRIRQSFQGKFVDKADALAQEIRNLGSDTSGKAPAAAEDTASRDAEPAREEQGSTRDQEPAGADQGEHERGSERQAVRRQPAEESSYEAPPASAIERNADREYDDPRDRRMDREDRGDDAFRRESAGREEAAENTSGIRRIPYVEAEAAAPAREERGTMRGTAGHEGSQEERTPAQTPGYREMDRQTGSTGWHTGRMDQAETPMPAPETTSDAGSEENLSVGQVYDEWERIRRDIRKQNDQKRAQRIMEDTGPLLQDFDETARHGLIETIEKDAARQRRQVRSGAASILGGDSGYGSYDQGRGRYDAPPSRGRSDYGDPDDGRYGAPGRSGRDVYADDRYDDAGQTGNDAYADDRYDSRVQRGRDDYAVDRYDDAGQTGNNAYADDRYDSRVQRGRDDYADDRYDDAGQTGNDAYADDRYDDRVQRGRDDYADDRYDDARQTGNDTYADDRYDSRVQRGRDDYADNRYDDVPETDDRGNAGGRYDDHRRYEPLPEPEGEIRDREEITAETIHEEPESRYGRGEINDQRSSERDGFARNVARNAAGLVDEAAEIADNAAEAAVNSARRGSRFTAAVAAADLAADAAANVASGMAEEDDIATRRWNSEEIRQAMELQQRRIQEAERAAAEEAAAAEAREREEAERKAAEEAAAAERARIEAEIRARYEAEEAARIAAEEAARKAAEERAAAEARAREEEAARARMYEEIEARIRAEFEAREQARLAALGITPGEVAAVADIVAEDTAGTAADTRETSAGTETGAETAPVIETEMPVAPQEEPVPVDVPEGTEPAAEADVAGATETMPEEDMAPGAESETVSDEEAAPEVDENRPAEELPDHGEDEEPAGEPEIPADEAETPVRERMPRRRRVAATTAAEASADTDNIPASAASSIAAAAEKAPSQEELTLFGPFYRMRENRDQVTAALDRISLASYTGNLIITGNAITARRVAQGLLELTKEADSNFTGKIAKASGTALNKLSEDKFRGIIDKIENGALIIEHATVMEETALQYLYNELEGREHGLIVVMMDARKPLDAFLAEHASLLGSFTARVDIRPLNDKALLEYGKDYANSQDYALDELAELALSSRIASMQTPSHRVTLKEVRDIVDEAIKYGSKKTPHALMEMISRKRYDADDRIILHEKDFQHY